MAANKRRRKSSQSQQADRRFFLLVAGGVILIAVAVVLFYAGRESTADDDSPAVPAPSFALNGLDGPVSLDDFRGQYVLVNFWASWCPPCKAEMPDLYAYHRAHQDEGFTLLAINAGEDAATAQQFMDANRFDFPVALDTTMAVYTRYNAQGLPSSFLTGPDGKLVKPWPAGPISRAVLERDVTPLLDG